MRKTIVILIFAMAAMRAEATPPRLELDSAYIDMGRVPSDSVVEATMRVRNVGGEDLKILRVFSDCGCTVPSYPTDAISPGEVGEIRIRFNGKGRLRGAFRKHLRIRSNADNSRETITVKGILF